MTNGELEKYKIMQKFALNEGHVLWSFSQSFLIANTIILAFISQKLSDNFLNKPNLLVFLLSLIGFLITALWLSSYRRRSKYYEFRVAQLSSIEPDSWGFVSGIGKKFADGEKVKIKINSKEKKDYQLDFFGRPRTRTVATIFIFVFLLVYGFLIYTTLPLDIKIKPTETTNIPIKFFDSEKK